MMAFCPEHPKRDQNPKFTPLSETTSIPTPFICGFPPRGGGNQGNDSGLILLVKKGDRSKIIVDRAVSPTNGFLGVYLQLLNSQLLLRRSYLHLEFDFRSSHHLHVSFLSPVKVNSTNWSAPNVWAS